MSPEDKSWSEYRLLFENEMQDNREFREETRKALDSINTHLTEMKVERKIGKWVLGVIIPTVVAAVVTGVAKAMGW